eukprot:TRINITY_DN6124_c0_g1_i4.p1 TRINITY_DN6124_c0_g1~~TRINITY_DN6124_c0_g1_i4.p1  ORF type:complete len:480 (-),score=89.75 TRINITY_DN6124_c0_g1_i4:156-1595(-)
MTAPADGYKLFVGSLPTDCSHDELSTVFSTYGEVTHIHVMNPHPRSGQRCAFVFYANKESGDDAVKVLDSQYKIRTDAPHPIVVRWSKDSGFDSCDGKGDGKGEWNDGRPRRSEPPTDGFKLFVGGLPADVTEEELRLVFGTYGEVMHCHIMGAHPRSGLRCAFVYYDKYDGAEDAIKVLDGIYKIRTDAEDAIQVRWANKDSASWNSPGEKGDRKGFGKGDFWGGGKGDAWSAGKGMRNDPWGLKGDSWGKGKDKGGKGWQSWEEQGGGWSDKGGGWQDKGWSDWGGGKGGGGPHSWNDKGASSWSREGKGGWGGGKGSWKGGDAWQDDQWMESGDHWKGSSSWGPGDGGKMGKGGWGLGSGGKDGKGWKGEYRGYEEPSPDPNGTKLYVANLPEDIQESAVDYVFSTYGKVEKIHLMTGKVRHGCISAFVEFSTPEEANTAISSLDNKYEIRNGYGPITVKLANAKMQYPVWPMNER